MVVVNYELDRRMGSKISVNEVIISGTGPRFSKRVSNIDMNYEPSREVKSQQDDNSYLLTIMLCIYPDRLTW